MLTKLYVKSSVALSARKNQRGVTAIEYAIIGVAISAIVLAVFNGNGGLKEALKTAMNAITTNIGNASSTTATPAP